VEAVLSKALLTGRLKSWQVYVFYVGIFSAFSFLLFPFGLAWSGWESFSASFLSGVIFLGSIGFLFCALYKSSASRVYVLFGSVSTVTTLLLSDIIVGQPATVNEFVGILILLLGGFFISFKFYKGRLFSSWKKILIAGVLNGVSLVILKVSYEQQNFISGYIYSRLGIVFGTLVLFGWPTFRQAINKGLSKGRKKKAGDLFGVIGTKALAGLGTIIVQYAIFLGNVAIVNALVSVQYLFTFILSITLSIFFKKIFREEIFASNLFFKLIGVVLVVIGVFLVNVKFDF
jgi:drug/metabolite transporter (DMT)-like permease